jgi:hypothetical protein
MKWSEDEEAKLKYLVFDGWCWQWPGWKWVAERLNYDFKSGRSAYACASKFQRLLSNTTPSERSTYDDSERRMVEENTT